MHRSVGRRSLEKPRAFIPNGCQDRTIMYIRAHRGSFLHTRIINYVIGDVIPVPIPRADEMHPV